MVVVVVVAVVVACEVRFTYTPQRVYQSVKPSVDCWSQVVKRPKPPLASWPTDVIQGRHGSGDQASFKLVKTTGHCSTVLEKFLDRLIGLVVKASASRAEGPGFESRLRRDFFGVESYQ